jgi:hypothetical protein
MEIVDEANFSAQQPPAPQDARLPDADGDEERPAGSETPPQ